MTEVIIVFVIFAISAIYELETIRKNAAQIRVMMELEQSTLRAACHDIGSIRHMLETEIADGRDRRVREASI